MRRCTSEARLALGCLLASSSVLPASAVLPDRFNDAELGRSMDGPAMPSGPLFVPIQLTGEAELDGRACLGVVAPAALLPPARVGWDAARKFDFSPLRMELGKRPAERNARAKEPPVRQLVEAARGAPIAQWLFNGEAPAGYRLRLDAEGVLVMTDPMGAESHYRLRLERADEPETAVEARTESARPASQVDEYVARVAHDLRSPLAAIMGAAELLKTYLPQFSEEEIRGWIATIIKNCRAPLEMIRDLLDLARMSSGILRVTPERSGALALAQQSVETGRILASPKNIDLRLETPEAEPPDVVADAGRVGQVLDNLISNALKFAPINGLIRVTIAPWTEEGRSFARFSVADNGPGIPTADLRRIFDRFAQSLEGRRHRSGAGLGLANAQNIVHLHGGKIWAENRPEGGAVFHFTLPAAAKD